MPVLPLPPGWIPAVCRGACNRAYDSMASSYDRLGRPAVVVVKGEETTTVLCHQTAEDECRCLAVLRRLELLTQ